MSRTPNADIFAQRLAETIAWCSARVDCADPKWCLRSEELRPDEDFGSPDDPSFWNSETTIRLVTERRSKIANVFDPSICHPYDLHSGRLLLCYHQWNNHSELTAGETKWYFDSYDNPPWDTWVEQFGDALVAWTPPEFHDAVDHAVSIECVGMLMWLDHPIPGWAVTQNDIEMLPDWIHDYRPTR